jgi:hypothetical protein
MAATDWALYKVNPIALDWDRDDLYTSHPSRFVWWQGSVYPTLTALSAATGQESHGLALPPQLVAPQDGVYRPAATSPLRDAGEPIPGINDGFEGSAPDLGAVEWRRTIFADGFESGGAASWRAGRPGD